VLIGPKAVRKIQMVHILGMLHEEAKQGPFNFPDLDIPQGEFPDIAFQEALEYLLEDPRIEDAS
jgi:hypothetical protein